MLNSLGLGDKSVLALAALMAVSLAGCGAPGSNSLASDIASFNASVANDLPAACALIVSPDVSFQTVAATGKLSPSAVAKQKAAMAGVETICANPGAVNAATALPTLAAAYAAVLQANNPN
jgi:hypothetical protein